MIVRRFGTAADQVPVAAAGNYLAEVRSAGGTTGVAPLASPVDTLTRALVELRLHPELRAQLADTHGNYAREHAPGLGLGAALCLALGPVVTDLLDALGFDGEDHAQHFVATTAIVHTATPPLARAAQVITNRVVGRQLGGVAVDFVGQAALRGGAVAVTAIERGSLLRNIGRAMAFQLLPEGASVGARIVGGLRGFGGALRNAWFMPGVTWGRLLDTGLDKLIPGYATWGGRSALSLTLTFAPDIVDLASKGGLTRWLTRSVVGRGVARLTKVGASLAFWDLTSWGVMKARYGDRALRASAGDRAAEIGDEAEKMRPLLRALRWVGLGKDFADTIGSGDFPILSEIVDGLDWLKLQFGLIDERLTVDAIRERVAARRGLLAEATLSEAKDFLQAELMDLGAEVGDLSPSRVLELVESGWLGEVRLPQALRGYTADGEGLYDRIRMLGKYRIDDSDAARVAAWFTDELFGSTAASPPAAGSSVLRNEAAMWEWLGGRDQVRAERRRLLYGVLITQQLQLAKAGLGLHDLRDLARDVRRSAPVRVVEGGMTMHESVAREIDATAALIEWAQQHGFIGEDGEIRADADYYVALSRYSASARVSGDADSLLLLRTLAVARGMGMEAPDLSAEERARYVSELKILQPDALFGEGSLQADVLGAAITRHGDAVRLARETTDATCGPTHAPEADAALNERARQELQAAREALVGGVMARTELPRYLPLTGDFGVATALTTLHDGLSAHGRRAAAAAVASRLSAAETDAELQTAYEAGGAAFAEFYGSTRETSRSLAHDKAEATATLEESVVLDPALSDVPAMLRRAVQADPSLAESYGINPETGAFTSAAALQAFLMPALREAQKIDEEHLTMTHAIGTIARPDPANLLAPPQAYQDAKVGKINEVAALLQPRLASLMIEAVATGHGDPMGASRWDAEGARSWMAARLSQDPEIARLIQHFIALHRQAHLAETGEARPVWHALTSDGQVDDWETVLAWAAPDVHRAATTQLEMAELLLNALPKEHPQRGELALQAVRLQWHLVQRSAGVAELDALDERIRNLRGPLGVPLTSKVERELDTLQAAMAALREKAAWQAETAQLLRAVEHARPAPGLGAHGVHWGNRYYVGAPAIPETPREPAVYVAPTRCASHH
ncbi:MAG: hypothetical protein HY696_00745 [Deltaproteobacteria bacterium]|nr:hypothetical protein [Deltaproteobacteria bacterium]